MARYKSGPTTSPAGGLGSLLRARGLLLFSLGVTLAVLTFGTVWVWSVVRQRVLDTPEYRVDPREIAINPPPEWITADDLKQEVIRNASLDQPLSIMDEKLTERLAMAFAAHPWVLRVESVEKYHPARVVVHLVYRVPVAAVAEGSELLPVDRAAMLLPAEHFSRVQLAKLPRIGGITSAPGVRPGNVWPDARVQGAALVAEAIGEQWRPFDLVEIVPSLQPARGRRNSYSFDLVTRGGKHIAWGRQPLDDDPSEPAPADKLRRLKTYVDQHGTLDGISQAEGAEPAVPRTARAQ